MKYATEHVMREIFEKIGKLNCGYIEEREINILKKKEWLI